GTNHRRQCPSGRSEPHEHSQRERAADVHHEQAQPGVQDATDPAIHEVPQNRTEPAGQRGRGDHATVPSMAGGGEPTRNPTPAATTPTAALPSAYAAPRATCPSSPQVPASTAEV